MLFGYARLLAALGPDAFASEEMRDLYLQSQLFEISRALLLSQRTCLSLPAWRALNRSLYQYDEQGCSISEVFDMVLQCAMCAQRYSLLLHSNCFDTAANCRRRTLGFVHTLPKSELNGDDVLQLSLLAREGVLLESTLLAYGRQLCAIQSTSSTNDTTRVSQMYYHAMRIYLSGIYHYDHIWTKYGIATPTLDLETVDRHVVQILDASSTILQAKTYSTLLVLIPLRIAGARGRTIDQRQRIRKMLLQVRNLFAVADAFWGELENVWADRFGWDGECSSTDAESM